MMDIAVNRLAEATSPYLQQHARNPVDWWPWCDQALARARDQGKPILLSIGYSACHWCHVMAHESFEDVKTAALMNELYVNIKVDREERPDLDKIYQTAHQLLTQRPGGWPLTVFLSPYDHMPFFVGTYYPNKPRHGVMSFRDLLRSVHVAWEEQQDAIRGQNQSMAEAFRDLNPKGGIELRAFDARPLTAARHHLSGIFDATHGGFGRAPKFPHCSSLQRLLRHWAANPGDSGALHMVLFSLERMASGGLYDQLGGGFSRYSVDDQWMIPHFEKMLYDNGSLLALNADAWQAIGMPLFARVCEGTANWVMREMQSPKGGYYSTIDADSEGEEGKFYVWTPGEIRSLLDAEEYDLVSRMYGLDGEANFEGHWHLHGFENPASLAELTGLAEHEIETLLAAARKKLFEARERRIRPGRDEKVLTSWNALMIKGMARAGRIFGRADWIESAEDALTFIRSTLWRDGRLLATYKDGVAHLTAYLDDYANLIDALLELLQARWKDEDLEWAITLADVLLNHFEDKELGGFWFTADDHEPLIHRPKPFSDESVPAGNGVAAFVLQRLGWLLAEPRYLEAAERTLAIGWKAITEAPTGHCTALDAVEEMLDPAEMLILRAAPEKLETWSAALGAKFTPTRMVFSIPPEADLPPSLADKSMAGDGVIYRCIGTRCQAPLSTPAELLAS